MKQAVWLSAVWLALLIPSARAEDAQLAKVLAQMDAASAKFTTASANFSWDQLTAVVDEHDIQKGTIAFRRGAGGPAMVVHKLTENGQPAPEDVLYQSGELDYYQPGIHQETILHAGGRQNRFESYATLGFGGSGRDLQANWNVAYNGADKVDGVAVARLTLTPKHPGPDQMFTKVEIWIDPATATSRKQVFSTAGGDTRTATYTNVVENRTKDSAFHLEIPSGTQKIAK